MIKIIRLDPKKDQKTINEIQNVIDELFGTYDSFMNDLFGKSLFSIPYEPQKKEPLKKEWIRLGDLVDKFYKKEETKSTPYSNQCCEKKEELEEDYGDVKNIDHIV